MKCFFMLNNRTKIRYNEFMRREEQVQEKKSIRISVRNLVEFIMREGDIDNRQGKGSSAEAMQEGSRMHRKIQRRMGSNYHAEVPLKFLVEEENYTLAIEGRADGIMIDNWEEADASVNYNHAKIPEQAIVTIDEIKGIYRKLESLDAPVGVHRAQAMCYAYIFATQHDLKRIRVQMTYCNLDTEDIRYFTEEFAYEDLEKWFFHLIGEYKKWADFEYSWHLLRQDSIKRLPFPFPYRKGQKELAAGVYRTIARKKNLFIQAPTGVGKTVTTVYPAVKAVGEELGDKIFYLTAKTITGTVARETFELLRRQGYQAKVVTITAKEKLCMCEEMECNPEHCPYAKGHYDRVNDAVYDLIRKEDIFTREILKEQAEQYCVCPFEMCLDVAVWSDNIICDYNYAFDPNVYLKRFFQEGVRGDYIFLVDEAHNLVERSREMYSASLYKEDFLTMKKYLKRYDKRIEQGLARCNKILLEYKRECENYVLYDNVGNFLFACMSLASDLDEFLQKPIEFPERKEVTDFYLQLRNFINIYELVDEHYVIYSQHDEDGRFKLKLYCVDPSANLQQCLDRANATIFFSATFLPIQYYKNLLSTKKDNYAVYAETAFAPEQKLLLIGRDVSSRYTRRNETEFEKIASYIEQMAEAKKGNYIAFFPSYRMMEQVYSCFMEKNGERTDCLMQESGMHEEEREAFLEEFSKEREHSFVAFCVMGGIFGEGIDLKREQLIGTVIVGTGLPQISREREILMNYYQHRNGGGFDYAYRYPGMNKVLQAAGRVIRTAEDTGVILLLDERFLQSDYKALFPREWDTYKICSLDTVSKELTEFWDEKRESR